MYMRRLLKRMAAAALVSACLVSLSACSQKETDTEALSISTDGTPVEDSMADASFFLRPRRWELLMSS